MSKHFKFTGETKAVFGVTLHRIEATRDLPCGVKAGENGGWVEKESQVFGNAWVYGNAQVSGDAWVSGNAQVSGDAQVYGNAQVSGNARVSGNAQVFGNAWVYGNAQVSGDAWVSGNAQVSGDAQVYGNAQVSGNAQVDSAAAILWITIGAFYTATIVRKYVFIGCKSWTREEARKLTSEQAKEAGCPEHLFKPLRQMILWGQRIVKEEP